MAQIDPLLVEFLAWVGDQPRSYADAMAAWRSNCPRHTVWEDALADDLIEVRPAPTLDASPVVLTSKGQLLLNGARKSR